MCDHTIQCDKNTCFFLMLSKMSTNDYGGRESVSSKVRFHMRGKESEGSRTSGNCSSSRSYVYEEEGESERSQQSGREIVGKCERELSGYGKSFSGNSNRF